MIRRLVTIFVLLFLTATGAFAAKAEKGDAGAEEKELWSAETFKGLKLRSIGPALTSGRISDFAVHPRNRKIYYVAVASGGVWKTVNSGTTWKPIFDDQGSYSIGCVAIDPTNPLIVWVGTGENNSQRSVGYGDGVYKSEDGGNTWKKVGLEKSEHIGKVLIHPQDSKTVYVAAQGPLWAPGGDRGLYRTTDGGKTWKRVLEISDNTGVSDVVMDPRYPEVLYASAYQRRRHVWTLINGGPESAIYKSTDGGDSWKKLEKGLPKEEMGRIGLAVSPANPDVVYAVIEAANNSGGFYRSLDMGSTWEKMSDYVSNSPQYYQEIIPDPKDPDRVYSNDTFMHVTEDGGKTFSRVPEATKHVDNHALWIDPEDTDYLLAGCDGGVYESFDRAQTWYFKANLPVTQFYKGAVDNDVPFYNVYGGTQDNYTLGGPSRTTSVVGIANSDWFITLTGDGFQPQADPENPDIVYSQWQYGNLHRYDRKSGEQLDIKPYPDHDGPPLRFHWDSPLILSPHSPTRIYFGAQMVYRSDDRGSTWTAVSPDLTRQLDRNQLEVMGKVWGVDAVAKNNSTSFYGNVVALAESPLEENLLYAGTDDGLIQVSEDGGANWHKVEDIPGVPRLAYVRSVKASRHDADTVYAAFDNHKMGDFKPHLYRSTDRGRTWTSITDDLPERGSVYALAEDHIKAELLFAGTEFGLFFTVDGGQRWVQIEGGLPTVNIRDLVIQERENDLIAVTFGRGFFILDDYTPLRQLTPETLEHAETILFPVKKTWMYVPTYTLGYRGNTFHGDAYFAAPNPPFGAVFTYYLKEELKTRQKQRQEEEKKVAEAGGTIRYPSWDELRKEAREEAPAILLAIRDEDGNVIRRLTGPTEAGFHRVAWDLRHAPADPISLEAEELDPWEEPPAGPMVVPGTYTVSLAMVRDGQINDTGQSQSFETVPLGLATLPAENRAEQLAFQRKTARLQRAVLGAVKAADEAQSRIDHIQKALPNTPAAEPELDQQARALEERLQDLRIELEGDPVIRQHNEPTLPGIVGRVNRIIEGHWRSTSAATQTQRDSYAEAAEAFSRVLEDLRQLIEVDLTGLESRLEAVGAPWTPGRVPRWQPE